MSHEGAFHFSYYSQGGVVSISDVVINNLDIMTDSHFQRFFGGVKVVLCIIFENIVILSGVVTPMDLNLSYSYT